MENLILEIVNIIQQTYPIGVKFDSPYYTLTNNYKRYEETIRAKIEKNDISAWLNFSNNFSLGKLSIEDASLPLTPGYLGEIKLTEVSTDSCVYRKWLIIEIVYLDISSRFMLKKLFLP